jgi:hypothetical protein
MVISFIVQAPWRPPIRSIIRVIVTTVHRRDRELDMLGTLRPQNRLNSLPDLLLGATQSRCSGAASAGFRE